VSELTAKVPWYNKIVGTTNPQIKLIIPFIPVKLLNHDHSPST
jgi:hypothetical protein